MKYVIEPVGDWPHKPTEPRKSSTRFKVGWQDILDQLARELDYLDAGEPVVFQVDVEDAQIRRDGMLRSTALVRHPGVILSFASRYGPLRYVCDTYEQHWGGALPGWQANLRAVGLTLEAQRAIDRWGVTRRGEQYTGWLAIEKPGPLFSTVAEAADWMRKYAAMTLNMFKETQPPDLDSDGGWKYLYRRMAAVMHPDRGGGESDWLRLDEARRLLREAGWM